MTKYWTFSSPTNAAIRGVTKDLSLDTISGVFDTYIQYCKKINYITFEVYQHTIVHYTLCIVICVGGSKGIRKHYITYCNMCQFTSTRDMVNAIIPNGGKCHNTLRVHNNYLSVKSGVKAFWPPRGSPWTPKSSNMQMYLDTNRNAKNVFAGEMKAPPLDQNHNACSVLNDIHHLSVVYTALDMFQIRRCCCSIEHGQYRFRDSTQVVRSIFSFAPGTSYNYESKKLQMGNDRPWLLLKRCINFQSP